MAAGETCGILFGPRAHRPHQRQTSLAETVITVPLNPAFSSLNLAQAVLLVGYEWFQAGDATPAEQLHVGQSRPATKAELERFFDQLEEELIVSGFLREREKRPSMVRNLRTLFQRAAMHGAGAPHPPRRGHRLRRPAQSAGQEETGGVGVFSLLNQRPGPRVGSGRQISPGLTFERSPL